MGVQLRRHELAFVHLAREHTAGPAARVLDRAAALRLGRDLLRTRTISPAALRARVREALGGPLSVPDAALPEAFATAITRRLLWVTLREPRVPAGGGSGHGGAADEFIRVPPPEAPPPEGLDLDYVIQDNDDPRIVAEFIVTDESDATALTSEVAVIDENEPHLESEAELVDESEPHLESELAIHENDAA